MPVMPECTKVESPMTATLCFSVFSPAGQVKAVEAGAGGTHTDVQVHGVQRRRNPQGITADVAIHHALVL